MAERKAIDAVEDQPQCQLLWLLLVIVLTAARRTRERSD